MGARLRLSRIFPKEAATHGPTEWIMCRWMLYPDAWKFDSFSSVFSSANGVAV
jgi:hypothetical protein